MDRINAIAAAQIAHAVSREDARREPRRDVRALHAAFAHAHKSLLLALGGLPA